MESPGRLSSLAYAVLVSSFSLLPKFKCVSTFHKALRSAFLWSSALSVWEFVAVLLVAYLYLLFFLTLSSPDMPGFGSLNFKNRDKGEVVSFKNKLVPFLSVRLAEYRRWCWRFETWFPETTRNKNVLLLKIFLVLF